MSELIHYGVLGMKWGVRKDGKPQGYQYGSAKPLENSRGKVSKRKLNKAMKRSWDEKGNWEHRDAVNKKVDEQALKTKEGKAYTQIVKERGNIRVNGKPQFSYYDKDYTTEELLDRIMKDQEIEDAYWKKNIEIAQSYIDEFAGALLIDVGYADTEIGREAVKKAMGY